MDIASLIVSIVALAVAIGLSAFGIWLQWDMYQKSSDQLTDAKEVIAEIKGYSKGIAESQQEQSQKMLDVILKERNTQVQDASNDIGKVERRLQQLEEQQPDVASTLSEIRSSLGGVQETLREIQSPKPEGLAGLFYSPITDPLQATYATRIGVPDLESIIHGTTDEASTQ